MSLTLPTNRPGDNLYKKIETIKHDKFDDAFALPFGTSILLLMSIFSYIGLFPAHNIIILITALIIWILSIIYTVFKVRKLRKELKAYRKGLEGERYIGAVLERFRLKGAEVFHDICFDDKFNIDHIIISTKGIFVIETKNYSKTKGYVVNLEKSRIMINNHDHSEIYKKVDSYATHLSSLMSELTGKEFPIKKVILFPGWYIEGKCATSDFWVLNEKAFMKFFDNQKDIYKESDIAALKTQIRYWIVNHTENKPLI